MIYLGDIIFFCQHLLELQFLACETANLHFISDNKINLLAPREITTHSFLVLKDILDIVTAADEVDISVEKFKKLMGKAGYKLQEKN